MNDTEIPAPDTLADPMLFLEAVYGTGAGRGHWAIGVDGHFVGTNYRFGKGNWSEHHFPYPPVANTTAIEEMLAAAQEADVYLCPYLMYGHNRTPGGTVERKLLHVDWDGELADMGLCLQKVAEVGGFAVASGTEGHLQVYVPLAESVPAIRHRELCEGLHRVLPPGADTKKATNDVFRIPGTFNHKGRARGGESARVTFSIRPSGARIDPDTLAIIVGVGSTAETGIPGPQQPHTPTNGAEPVGPVDLELYPAVVSSLGVVTNRSDDTMRVVGACHDAGLTLAQTRWVVGTRTDLTVRLGERHDDDVLVCWLKVTDTRQDHKPGPLFNFSANGHKASDGGKPTPGRKVSLVSATGIVSDKPVWAMEYGGIGCIQRGSFALWAGRPGAGKSTAARWLAAGYSLGIIEGCWHGQPQNVAYLAPSEESLTYTIKPGLIAAGADISRICFPHVHAEDKVVQLRSLIDEEALTEQLLAADVSVVVVDPVMATIGSKVDINRNNEVRTFIEVWPRIATAIDGIVTGIAHLVKAPGGDIVAAINGSSAFGEVARAIFGFAKDPNSEQDHRIMSQEKNSTGREDLALTYAIESQEITTDTNKSAEVGKFVILGNSERTVSDLLRDGMEKHTVNKEATDWLSDYLTASGRTASKVVKKAAKNDGDFSERTIQRAASDLKVVSTSEGFPRVTYWHLPGLEDGADLCMRCGKPMLLGQTGVHLTCSKTERDDAQ